MLTGSLAADERLPSERRLAQEFGVSRPVVREALRSLVERGLIEVEPSRGAFVRGDTGPVSFPSRSISSTAAGEPPLGSCRRHD